MYPLFETICVKNGLVRNGHWHQKRYEQSFETFYSKKPVSALFSGIEVPQEFSTGICKLRISYNETSKKIEFEKNTFVIGKSLKLVNADDIDYSLKYTNRDRLNHLYTLRGNCDDVLIAKKGMLSDTVYANIVFTDGKKWSTPSTPLLEGTCRARLLAEESIEEAEITIKDLDRFIGFKLINAMNDLDKGKFQKIENIFR